MTEDKMVGWHHRHNGHGFGWTLGAGDGQGGLVYCSSWGCKESDKTERLSTDENHKSYILLMFAVGTNCSSWDAVLVLMYLFQRGGIRGFLFFPVVLTYISKPFQLNANNQWYHTVPK